MSSSASPVNRHTYLPQPTLRAGYQTHRCVEPLQARLHRHTLHLVEKQELSGVCVSANGTAVHSQKQCNALTSRQVLLPLSRIRIPIVFLARRLGRREGRVVVRTSVGKVQVSVTGHGLPNIYEMEVRAASNQILYSFSCSIPSCCCAAVAGCHCCCLLL